MSNECGAGGFVEHMPVPGRAVSNTMAGPRPDTSNARGGRCLEASSASRRALAMSAACEHGGDVSSTRRQHGAVSRARNGVEHAGRRHLQHVRGGCVERVGQRRA